MKSLRQSLHKQDLLGLGIMVILFVVFYFLFDEEILDDYWETNVILILINIIMAVSLNLINGLTGQFSIGHAGFMAVGAYTSAIITVKLGMDFPIALIVATVSAAFLGFLIGMPTLRLNGDYLAIATLGFAEIIRAAVVYEGFGPLTNGSNLLYGFTSFASFNLSLGGTTLHLETVMPFLFSGICIAIILLLINSTSVSYTHLTLPTT